MTDIYLTISLSIHNGYDTPQNPSSIFVLAELRYINEVQENVS